MKQEFDRLKDEWINEVQWLSSSRQQLKHPNGLRIVEMGQEALPYIIEEIKIRPMIAWFDILETICGIDAAEGATTMQEAVAMWEDFVVWRVY